MTTAFIIALALCVVVFFGIDQRRHVDTQRRLNKCDEERRRMESRLARLEAGCGYVHCPLRETEEARG